MPDRSPSASDVDERPSQREYTPIAIGFTLIAVPLWVAVFLAENAAGAWANGVAAGVMTLLGALIARRRS